MSASPTILIVEDSRIQAELLRRLLHEAGFAVEIASHGAQALDKARRLHPAAIVSDVNMPVMDGYTLCAQIRADASVSATPVILVTTLSDPGDVLHGMQAGADAYLTKPYNAASLLSWLGILLARPAGAGVELSPVQFWANGQAHSVQVNAQRMMNLLASTYENAVLQNRELHATQMALAELNTTLEQRVRAQTRALHESERRLRALLEHASDLVLVVDDAGRIRFVGPSIERLCGYLPGEWTDRPFLEFAHPDERASLAARLADFRQRPGELFSFELRCQHRDGHWIHLEANASNALDDAAVAGFVINLRDISARKQADEHIRKLSMAVEQSSESVVITDTRGRIEYVNAAFVNNTGFSQQEASGHTVNHLLNSGKTPSATYEDLWSRLRQGQSWSGEFCNRRKDGSEFLSAATISPIRQADGRITHYLSVQEDVTDRRRMAQELNQHRLHLEELVRQRTAELREAQQRAEQANQAKSAFLANMSHEIRTPMNAIIGLTHMLRRQQPRADQLERLDKINGAANHLLSVINDILDLSKIEAGKMQLDPSDFDPEQTVQNVCNIIQDQIARKGLELVVDLRALPATLHGDGLRIGQVLLNLAGNAVKFTEKGSITLRAWVSGAADSGMTIRFEVADTGLGITPEQRERLFQPFEQADRSTTRKYGGTGLGLAISRRLVQMMGGSIGVDSEPGRGSTFWVEIPLGFGNAMIPVRHERVDTYRLRALVVDAVPETCEALVDGLQRLGLRVSAAADPSTVLARVQQADLAGDPYALMLIAARGAGLALGQRLQRLPLSCQPVRLLLTGPGEEVSAEQLTPAGFVGVLPKPLTPTRLFEAVQGALSGEQSVAADVGPGRAEAALRQRPPSRVLLAEDNRINQEVASELLRSVGIEPDLAANGDIAVAMARANAYDLILMDMHMPVLDGLDASRQIRALPAYANVPILAMTANAFDEARDACLAAGMNDHIAKPVDPETLFDALLRWLPQRAAQAEAVVATTGSARGLSAAAPIIVPREAMTDGLAALGTIEGLDPAAGLRHANRNPDLYQRLLRNFIDNTSATELRQALARGEARAAQLAAHSLKGTAATLGATALADQAAMIEGQLKSGLVLDPAALQAAAQQLELGFHALARALGDCLPVSAQAASGPTALPAGGMALPELLNQLDQLLDSDDINAIDVFQRHRADLQQVFGKQTPQLEHLITHYMFGEAVAWLRASSLSLSGDDAADAP